MTFILSLHQYWEFDLIILASCFLLLFAGAGASSLDRMLLGL